MFQLDDQPAKILHFSPRAEKHGEDNQLAGDLKIQIKAANDILTAFDPALRDMLYHRAEGVADQGEIDGFEASDKPNLRCAKLGPLSLTTELVGYEMTVPYGLGGKSDVVLSEVKVNHFRAECHEGGTVTLTFRCQFTCDESQAGRLCALIGGEVEVDLGPSEEAQERMAA